MTIQAFGEYLDRLHPHLHVWVADGPLTLPNMFYVKPNSDIRFLEEIFRDKVLSMLDEKEKF